MTSDSLLRAKADRVFAVLDTDNDEVIERDAYLAEGYRFLDAFGVPADSSRGMAVIATRAATWERCTALVDRDLDGAICRDEFREWIRATQNAKGNSVEEVLAPMVRAQFDVVDADQDGLLNQEEFTKWRTCVGIPTQVVADSFAIMDADADGYITLDEFRPGWRSFAERADASPLASGSGSEDTATVAAPADE